jgi:hypothetical protein
VVPLRGCTAASSPEERMRCAARDASKRSVGALRRDDDGGDEETRPPATPADEEVEVASVAADEAPATKRAMMSHGGASGVPVQVQPLALQISSHSNVFSPSF